jgi:hypothetical protein
MLRVRRDLWTLAALFALGSAVVSARADTKADELCRPCHALQVSGYAKTAMAHSLSHTVSVPSGSFVHTISGTKFSIRSMPGSAEIAFERGEFSGTYQSAYVIGSGTHASGLLIRVRDYLFQAPVSYYADRGKWGAAPGFESMQSLDFTRPVTPQCLFCHADRARPVPGTLNRYENPAVSGEAISCGRCHGDAQAHLRNPGPGNIVNPAKLPPRARDSVCEQCHLNGEARVLNPSRVWADFRPGEDLEQTFSVYVRDTRAGPAEASIKVISHAEQLALSACARHSGAKLWCGTCHDPHAQPADPVSYFRRRCLECHGQALLETHAKPADNCIGCHMPKREARDGAHTPFTDHLIARVPRPGTSENPALTKLRAWREPSGVLAVRNLGLANVDAGMRLQSNALIGEGANQLEQAAGPFPRDSAILADLGLVLLRAGQKLDAVKVLQAALSIAPETALAHIHLGDAYKELGSYEKAAAEFNRAIELDCSLQDAYRSLVETYLRAKQPDAARQTLQRYLEFMPQNIAAKTALAH